MRKTELLPELTQLSAQELVEFHYWLDQHTYKETQKKLLEAHKIHISLARLGRYSQALDFSEDLRTHTGLDVAIEDYIHLVNGEPLDFDAAGLHRIKKRVFDLTLDPKTKPSQLPMLFRILTYNDSLALRQQRADLHQQRVQIQERRLALDERKQQWRESLECGDASPLSRNTPSTEPAPHSPADSDTPASPAPRLPHELPLIDPTQMTPEEFRRHLQPTPPTDLAATNPSKMPNPIRFPTPAEWLEQAEEFWDDRRYCNETRKTILRSMGTDRYPELHPVNQPPGSKYWDAVKLTGRKYVDVPLNHKPKFYDSDITDAMDAIGARYFGPPIPAHLHWHPDQETWSTEPLPVLSEGERNPCLVRHDDEDHHGRLEQLHPEQTRAAA